MRGDTVSFVAGGALLAAGVAILIFAPGGDKSKSAALHAAPMIVANGGGLVLAGGW